MLCLLAFLHQLNSCLQVPIEQTHTSIHTYTDAAEHQHHHQQQNDYEQHLQEQTNQLLKLLHAGQQQPHGHPQQHQHDTRLLLEQQQKAQRLQAQVLELQHQLSSMQQQEQHQHHQQPPDASNSLSLVVSNLRQTLTHVQSMAAKAVRDNKVLAAENQQLLTAHGQQCRVVEQLQVCVCCACCEV